MAIVPGGCDRRPVGCYWDAWAALPAMQAALLLFAPAWCGGRRRYTWFLEAILLLLVAPAALFWTDFSLASWNWGVTAPPRLFPPHWLLPGFAALAGLLAFAIGLAPRSRFARFVLVSASIGSGGAAAVLGAVSRGVWTKVVSSQLTLGCLSGVPQPLQM